MDHEEQRMKTLSTEQALSLEIHLGTPQISALWNVDPKTVAAAFRNEPGVIWIKGRSRETMRVPISVVNRVHSRLSGIQ